MTFELHDFIDDQNFDQFIDLIQGETKNPFLVLFVESLVDVCDDSSTAPGQMIICLISMLQEWRYLILIILFLTLSGLNIGGDVKEGDHRDDQEQRQLMQVERNQRVIIDQELWSRSRRGEGKMKEKLYQLCAPDPSIT